MSDSESSGMSAIVAIIAIVAILVVGYFAMQMLSDNADNGPSINVDLPGTTGGGNANN